MRTQVRTLVSPARSIQTCQMVAYAEWHFLVENLTKYGKKMIALMLALTSYGNILQKMKSCGLKLLFYRNSCFAKCFHTLCSHIYLLKRYWPHFGRKCMTSICSCHTFQILVGMLAWNRTYFVYTLNKKSSWTLLKILFFQKCFILGQLKAYHRKQVGVFSNLIPNL